LYRAQFLTMSLTSFTYSNVNFRKYGGERLVNVQGEVTNSSERAFNTAAFRINIFAQGVIAWTGVFKVRNLRKGQTRAFELALDGAAPGLAAKITKYEICFESGY